MLPKATWNLDFLKNDMGGKHEGMEMCDKDVIM
jgi:hypothetical protein